MIDMELYEYNSVISTVTFALTKSCPQIIENMYWIVSLQSVL